MNKKELEKRITLYIKTIREYEKEAQELKANGEVEQYNSLWDFIQHYRKRVVYLMKEWENKEGLE